MKKLTLQIALALCPFLTIAQFDCINGLADDTYPCNQVTLQAHMSPEELLATEHRGLFLNDIWGWTDPDNGKEYALVGLSDGVSFVDISNPTSPLFIGKLPEPAGSSSRVASPQDIQHEKSTWRDIKVYKNHAFIVSDLNQDHGMQVFDLTKLRSPGSNLPITFTHDALYEGFGSAHNININDSTGYAYVAGISTPREVCTEGGLHIINIQNPLEPAYAGCFDQDGYTHDCQCVIYSGPDSDYTDQEICFNSNENTLTIADVSDKDATSLISRTTYDNVGYSHQGWLTEDHRFFLMNDETDELSLGHNPRTLIWNVEDLETPVLIGSYYNNEVAIDHNLYIKENLAYESNYLSGIRILSLDSVHLGKLREVAHFDTYSDADAFDFDGSWSNYPFFNSGNIIVSDMSNGLFILKPNLSAGIITAHPADQQVCEGSEVSFSVSTSTDGLTYQWQMFDGLGYVEVPDSIGSGKESATLTTSANLDNEGKIFRCVVETESKQTFYSYEASYKLVERLPVAKFTAVPNEPLVGALKSFSFENLSEFGNSYEWDFGDGNSSSEANPSHEYDAPGDYTVTLTASNNCGSTTAQQEISVLEALKDGLSASWINFHPNPAKNYITLDLEHRAFVRIYDSSGSLVLKGWTSTGDKSINTQKLKPGIYVLQVTVNDELLTGRFFKQ